MILLKKSKQHSMTRARQQILNGSFKQEKKHIADFIIEFKALAMKAEIDDIHAIFLLKKNVRSNIIKTILRYLPIAALELLKEQKVAITLVEQGYKSTKGRQDYRTGLGITYKERRVSMDIGKAKNNVVTTTSQDNQQTTKANLKTKYLIEITRELDKKSLLYFYTIYMIYRWSVLVINILSSSPYIVHKYTIYIL